MKKKIIFILAAVILIAISFGIWWMFFKNVEQKQLLTIKKERPELAEYVDKIVLWEGKIKEDSTRVESYLTLGMAWKGLADRTNNLVYYQKALSIYEQGINLTERKNVVFIVNAANMAIYLKDYALAERYLQEAITVNPGDWELYGKLAELYEYNLKKDQTDILAVFDKAKEKVINLKPIEQLRKEYLERNK